MATRRDPSFERQLLAGTTALMLLGTIEAAGRALHAYEIGSRLEASQDVRPKLSTLYPQLRGLESKGFLQSSLEPSSQGPARRVYAITPAGRKARASWHESWSSIARRVDGILEEIP